MKSCANRGTAVHRPYTTWESAITRMNIITKRTRVSANCKRDGRKSQSALLSGTLLRQDFLEKEGIEHLEKAIELTIPKDSTMIRLYKGLVDCCKLAQDTPKQIQALKELYKYDKTNHKLLYDIAWNYSYQLKDNKSAERYLQAFLKTRKANARKEEPVSEKGELVLGLENYYNAAENWLKDLQKEKFFKEGIPLESQKQ